MNMHTVQNMTITHLATIQLLACLILHITFHFTIKAVEFTQNLWYLALTMAITVATYNVQAALSLCIQL